MSLGIRLGVACRRGRGGRTGGCWGGDDGGGCHGHDLGLISPMESDDSFCSLTFLCCCDNIINHQPL